jgi:hypothetical protein
MKLDKNSLDAGLSFFKAIKVELYLGSIDLKVYHPASDGFVGIESVFLTNYHNRVVPKVLMRRKTLYKLTEELKETEKNKTKKEG